MLSLVTLRLKLVHMLRHVIASTSEWPKEFYSENGSYFVNNDVKVLVPKCGVSQYTGPLSHPTIKQAY